MELARAMGETSFVGRMLEVRIGGHQNETEGKVGSDMCFVECRSC